MKNNNPKVTIVIPVYNGSDYIEEALESAINQTYKNIEIVVVNDGSNDNGATKKVVEKYNDRVRYFEKENGGVSTALNLALEKMTGEYFSWLSHDDRYYLDKIESQLEYLKNFDNKTILYSDYDLMDSDSHIFATGKKDHDELMEKPEYALYRGAINGITLLIPKQAFNDFGSFDESLKCTQDYDMWLKMMQKYKFVHQSKVLSTTRLHAHQTTNTSPRVIEEGNQLWNNMIDCMTDDTMMRLEGSKLNFYVELKNFIATTPYTGTFDYLTSKIEQENEKVLIKMKNIKVSVIIPFYYRLDDVKHAIDSVLAQTHDNIEIIIVNDGTPEIRELKKSISNNKKIKLVESKENIGVSNARNLGLVNSSGDYIAFLDSDDLFLPTKIFEQLRYMLINNIDFSYTSYIRKNELGVETLIECASNNNSNLSFIYNCPVATPTIMISKNLVINHNLKYNVDFSYAEDVCFYLEILKHTSAKLLAIPLTIVNTNPSSSYNNFDRQIQGLKNILKYLLNDNHYKINHDNEISILCLSFYDFYTKKNEKLCDKETIPLTESENSDFIDKTSSKRTEKYLGIIKNDGLAKFLSFAVNKVLKKIKGNKYLKSVKSNGAKGTLKLMLKKIKGMIK